MTPDPQPKAPDAVRLARVAYPAGEWEDRGDSAFDLANQRVERSRYFDLDDLNNLALAEQRVIAAGYGLRLKDAMQRQLKEEQSSWEIAWLPAAQRRAALIAVLNENPKLEEQLAKHE